MKRYKKRKKGEKVLGRRHVWSSIYVWTGKQEKENQMGEGRGKEKGIEKQTARD